MDNKEAKRIYTLANNPHKLMRDKLATDQIRKFKESLRTGDEFKSCPVSVAKRHTVVQCCQTLNSLLTLLNTVSLFLPPPYRFTACWALLLFLWHFFVVGFTSVFLLRLTLTRRNCACCVRVCVQASRHAYVGGRGAGWLNGVGWGGVGEFLLSAASEKID